MVKKERQVTDMKKSLAVIIPVYRSKETVRELVLDLKEVFEPVCRLQIVLVDDGNAPDIAAYLIENCLLEYTSLVVLKRNFGQQNAVFCGLERSLGFDYIATLDDDLKHSADMLFVLWEKIQEGYDLVYGVPESSDNKYPFGSRMRDVLFSKALHCPKGMRVSSLRIMTGSVAKDVVTGHPGGFFYFSAAALKKNRDIANVTFSMEGQCGRSSGYSFRKRAGLFLRIVMNYCLPFRAGSKEPPYEILKIYPQIMVLGGSQCQLHAIQRASAQGMYTVLADYTEHPVGADYADVHEQISTFDAEACVKAAKKHNIQGVMTMGTDQPVYTAARVSKELSLPTCLTTEQALLVTNKKFMKKRLAEAGIPTVPWMLIDRNTTAKELRKLHPPYVIKPLDSQGQRGIFKLDTAEEVLEHLEKTLAFSRCEEALVEEFYENDEMTVSGYIDNGELTIFTIVDRLVYPDPVHIGVCVGHRFPSVHMGDYEIIKKISEDIVREFGLTSGPFYLQLLKGKRGIVVNELACRIGGAFEDVTIPWLTGFDILGAVIKNALGYPVDMSEYKNFRCDRLEKEAAVQLTFCRSGEIAEMTDREELLKLPFVLDCGYNYKPGDVVPSLENATARFGHAVLVGTGDTMAENINAFYEKFSVKNKDGEEMKLRLYPEK